MSLEPGQTIDGRYRIVRMIGEGGMGTVHEGENLLIHRRVAIKVLNAEAAASEAAVVRFEREAQAAGRIGSDHILEIIDVGALPSGERYMVMEYLDGETLSERIERAGHLTAHTVYPLVRQALVGLHAAHQAGIIHRDLKPDNLFILQEKADQGDFLKIIDFGVSKFTKGSNLAMTRTGTVVGTPYYMSPEQARGSPDIDGRSDVYAIGVILYEALSGHVPFSGDTFNELIFKIVTDDPVPLTVRVPSLDPGFARIVERAMAREAAQRFDSAEAMIGELDSWAAGVGLEVPRTSSLPSMIPEAAARTALRTTSPPRPTGSSWAMSQHPTRNARSALPLVLGAAAVAAALLGAGLYGAYRLLGAHDHAAIPAASPPASGLVVPSVASNKPVHESTGSSDDEVEPGGGEPPKHLAGDAHSGPQVRPVEAPSRPPSTGTVNPDAAKVDDASQAASRKTLAPTRQPARSAKKKLPDFGY